MKHQNPYNKTSNYFALFGKLRKLQVMTRQALVDFATSMGMSAAASQASVTVVLSPRKESKRGDCRGNMSAQGHLYCLEPLARVKGKDGKNEPRKFRLRWRTKALEPRKRLPKLATVKAQKTAVKAPAKKRTRKTVSA